MWINYSIERQYVQSLQKDCPTVCSAGPQRKNGFDLKVELLQKGKSMQEATDSRQGSCERDGPGAPFAFNQTKIGRS